MHELEKQKHLKINNLSFDVNKLGGMQIKLIGNRKKEKIFKW